MSPVGQDALLEALDKIEGVVLFGHWTTIPLA